MPKPCRAASSANLSRGPSVHLLHAGEVFHPSGNKALDDGSHHSAAHLTLAVPRGSFEAVLVGALDLERAHLLVAESTDEALPVTVELHAVADESVLVASKAVVQANVERAREPL